MKQTMETMERCDASMNRERQMDSLLNSVQTKYQKEILFLQEQYDTAITKLNQKVIINFIKFISVFVLIEFFNIYNFSYRKMILTP